MREAQHRLRCVGGDQRNCRIGSLLSLLCMFRGLNSTQASNETKEAKEGEGGAWKGKEDRVSPHLHMIWSCTVDTKDATRGLLDLGTFFDQVAVYKFNSEENGIFPI